ncbi:MAG: efflux RND transporter periplasmic adaptor subunit [Methylovirgula sp.]|nr:efflux RND transporter periplasmic adaptor subunit [Methylovirgula sp.]
MLAVIKTGRRVATFGLLASLGACQQENTYVPPPPPTVGVAYPIQKTVQPYLEATGNMAAVNSVNLVARVQGFLQEIDYKDGAAVKKGTKLFVIEPEPYKLKVDQAQAALEGAKAQLLNSQIEFNRQQTLVSRQVSTQASFDQARANRDLNQATVDQDQANLQQAQINYGYTRVDAPFDGTVTQHLVSVGELVGTNSPTQLATIYQLEPIWVNFTISERDVQTIRAAMAKHGITTADVVGKVPVEVALQTDRGFPYKGVIDYIAPNVDTSTGTLNVRGVLDNKDFRLLPGYYVRVHLPLRPVDALLVPEEAIGADQSGRYVLIVNAGNVVEQRKVTTGETFEGMRRILSGLTAKDKVIVAGLLQAAPGQKVVPQLQQMTATNSDTDAK